MPFIRAFGIRKWGGYRNAMTSHQTRTQLNKVAFWRSGFYNIVRIEAHCIENQGKSIHKSNVHIGLRVLDIFWSLSHLDWRRHVRTVDQNRIIHANHDVGNLRRTTRSYFLDLLKAWYFVAQINTRGRIAVKKSTLYFRPETHSTTGRHSSSVTLG